MNTKGGTVNLVKRTKDYQWQINTNILFFCSCNNHIYLKVMILKKPKDRKEHYRKAFPIQDMENGVL